MGTGRRPWEGVLSVASWAPRRSPRCRSGAGLLADNDGHRAAVLGIGRFGRTEFGRTFLAIADDVDAARVDAERRQVIFRGRSEEHTSELQSLMRISYAVFCLKKKT